MRFWHYLKPDPDHYKNRNDLRRRRCATVVNIGKGQIMHAYRTAAGTAPRTLESRPVCLAGFTANAITAICCSSICAIISSWPVRNEVGWTSFQDRSPAAGNSHLRLVGSNAVAIRKI